MLILKFKRFIFIWGFCFSWDFRNEW